MSPRRTSLLLAAIFIVVTLHFQTRHAVASEEGMVWQFSEFDDPENKGRMSARLTYGIPETDAVQVSGACHASPGTRSKFSVVTFGADVGDLEDGTLVNLRFLGGGFHYVLQGEVYGTAAEEGISGVMVRMEHDDPLWKVMDARQSLNYLVPGYTVAILNFGRGRGRENIHAFLEACRNYGANLPAK